MAIQIDKDKLPAHIQESLLKAERSIEIADDLYKLCLEHASTDDSALLDRAGSLLGDFVNNLRSALNYTMRGILTREVIPKLSSSKKKELERNMDFPWATSEKKFAKHKLCNIIEPVDKPLCTRIRRYQPYHPGNEWLGHLMKLSNTDKHVVLNRVRSPTASSFLAFLPDGTPLKEPWFVEDRLVLFTEDGLRQASLPYYYEPLKAVATPRETWNLYLVPVEDRFSLGLIDFTRTTPLRVVHILAALEALYDSFPALPNSQG